MDFTPSARAEAYLARVRAFLAARVAPVEARLVFERRAQNAGGDWRAWRVSPELEALRQAARREGLWNLFLRDETHGAGLSALEYAKVAEALGQSLIAPEIFNCQAPDSGNIEVLHFFGTDAQKERWLAPLLAGEIRSTFCMTEPDVASSDATNIRATIRVEGDELVLDGRKWWATGVGHPDARLALFMGVSEPEAAKHQRHSLVLVPLDAPGVRIERMLPILGELDAPHGHGELSFTGVRVPRANLLVGLGQGFSIAQARLGPGRVHHCMRALGAAEAALALMIRRGTTRVAFGKPLLELGGNLERIADLRLAIDQARLLTLHAAWKVDCVGGAAAMAEISAIKVVVPSVLQRIVDEAIQLFGAAGLSDDEPLTAFFTMARALRIVDGPDAVHRAVVARHELAKHRARDHREVL